MDLSPEHVRMMAGALGLDVRGEDLAEVTHRLNGLLEALAPLGALPLEAVEPLPCAPEPPEPR